MPTAAWPFQFVTDMDWFKFYGKDWMTDVKIMSMEAVDRLCYLTILCLASGTSNDGWVRATDEFTIIKLSHLNDNVYEETSEVARAQGVFERLRNNGMIRTTPNTLNPKTTDIFIPAFEKRQSAMSDAEKQRRYRARQKEAALPKVTEHGNALVTRVEEIREEKINTLPAKAGKLEVVSEHPTRRAPDDNARLILEEEEQRMGRKFANRVRQLKAIRESLDAGYLKDDVLEELKYLRKDHPYWRDRNPDFITVAQTIHIEH